MEKSKPVFWVYLLSILLVFHVAVPLYINSTFLSEFTSDDVVGLIYSIGAILTIITLILTSKALEVFGNYKTTLFLIFVEIFAVLGLAFSSDFLFLVIAPM